MSSSAVTSPAPHPLARLFEARSVAVIGASPPTDSDPFALRSKPLRFLRDHGYGGQVFSINPKYPEIFGFPGYASLDDIGAVPDAAIILLGGERLEQALEDCARLGVGAVIVIAGGYGERAGEGEARQKRLVDIIAGTGTRLVGPNTSGIVSAPDRLILGFNSNLEAEALCPGPVSVITQSGAVASSLMSRLNQTTLGYSRVVGCGNEADLGAADIVDYLATDDATSTIVLSLEAIRDADAFVAAVQRAVANGKRIAALKVGRSEQAQRSALAHTGAITGAHAITRTVLEELGVTVAESLEDLVASAQVLAAPRLPSARSFGVVTPSGGVSSIFADRCQDHGFELPTFSSETQARIVASRSLSVPLNPFDLTVPDSDKEDDYADVLASIAGEDVGAVVLLLNLVAEAGALSIAKKSAAAYADLPKPLYVYLPAGTVYPSVVEALSGAGVPTFTEVDTMLRAIDASLTASTSRHEPPVDASAPATELPTLESLHAAGVPLVLTETARSADEVVAIADRVGYPVAIKLPADRFPHKTDVGGVRVGIEDADAARAAFADLAAVFTQHVADEPARVEVQAMATPGMEMLVGITVDEQFGPFVVVGAGGVQVELLGDRVMSRAPVDAEQAEKMVRQLACFPLLDGYRSTEPYDVAALVATIVAASNVAYAHRQVLAELDLNPVIVHPRGEGASVVDAVVVGNA